MKIFALMLTQVLFIASVKAASPECFIRGTASPNAQIVVVNEITGAVTGYVASKDGKYQAGPLQPGHYRIVENAPHHAARHLILTEDRNGQVDL